MRSVYEERIAEATETRRRIMQGTARLCSNAFARAWKGVFPVKAAEELAARTGRSIRAAGYVLSGEQEPSGADIAALVIECTKRT